jgi:hypothetical protein
MLGKIPRFTHESDRLAHRMANVLRPRSSGIDFSIVSDIQNNLATAFRSHRIPYGYVVWNCAMLPENIHY